MNPFTWLLLGLAGFTAYDRLKQKVTVSIHAGYDPNAPTPTAGAWLHQLAGESLANWNNYKYAISSAEHAHGVPAGFLAALLYQETHYRSDIISGRTRSAVGAVGFAQALPATAADPGYGIPAFNPLDPVASIAFAANYLAALHKRTGSWPLAAAAYNAGLGAVNAAHGVPNNPETRQYVANITAWSGIYA